MHGNFIITFKLHFMPKCNRNVKKTFYSFHTYCMYMVHFGTEQCNNF